MEATAAGRYAPGPERPHPVTHNPLVRIGLDLRDEWRARGHFPPGPTSLSASRTYGIVHDPLPILLDCYERYGAVFTTRLFHGKQVWMLGPEANQYVLVSHPENFVWRDGSFGDLIPLLGDGLLTIDGDYHDRARRIMMPAFHSEQINASHATMAEEATAAMAGWRDGEVVDVYEWMRNLAMRIAMRALLGLDPDQAGRGAEAAHHFEVALGFYGTDAPARVLRGPGSAWRRMMRSRAVLDEIVFEEIERRRTHPDESRPDILSLLVSARDEDGSRLTDVEIRDQLMTLMFAGHDTSTSTVSFQLFELARNPEARERLCAELDDVLGGEAPDMATLHRELPYLEMVTDETLRLYPPAWIGPRRATRTFEFAGQEVPMGAYVNYCSWASHRLPHVFPDPGAFVPDRFTRERKTALPRGAYVPFGAGSRICIGKRFGQTEVKLVSAMVLQRFVFELEPDHEMVVRQMPTLGPKGGLPMRIRARR
ncbi:MAG: cytochrome P450 [Solirubrobacterales bacterium]